MQGKNAFNDQQRLGWNVCSAVAHAHVLRKVVDGSLDGLARGIVPDMALQQRQVQSVGRVVVLLLSFLQWKMVHLTGVDLHRDNVSIETRGYAFGYRGLAAAGR